MRGYGKVSPRFWNGPTGKRIRALGVEPQLVALYLMTSPSSSMTGLYYLPVPVLSHETGLPSEGASKALRSLAGVGFCSYDPDEEVVWVPEMARHQVGESLKPNDNRVAGVISALEPYRSSKFYRQFLARYGDVFSLADRVEAPPDRRGFEGASEPLRSQEQEQEQEQEEERAGEGARKGRSMAEPRAAATDALRRAADELWSAQEEAKADLRAAGVDPRSRGLGPVHSAKAELARRLSEQAAEGRGLEVARADCQHVLDVLLAEARVSGSLRWLDGGHWKPDRFAAALSQSPEGARHRAKERRASGAPGAAPPPRPAVNAVKPVEVAPEDRPTLDDIEEAKRMLGIGT